MNNPDIFNYDDLLHRLLGDRELAAAIIESFVAEIPAHLAKLEQAVGEENDDSAAKIAHYIKGEAGNLGAPTLRLSAAAMELALKSGDRQQALNGFESVKTAVGQLVKTLCR
jgi:HPt (histidine-containing phosphotransfer) domain-containing protein